MASWTWKPDPKGGYVSVGLRSEARLWKKGCKWFLTVDGKDHEIKSRRPSFDHAEGLLKTLGKTAHKDTEVMSIAERVAQRHATTTKTAGTKIAGNVSFKVEVFGLDDYHWDNQGGESKMTAVWKGQISVGKSSERFEIKIFYTKGKKPLTQLVKGSFLAGGILDSPEVTKFIKSHYKP